MLAAGRGRSIGIGSPTPHAATPSSIRWTPMSRAILAKAMLQLRAKTSVRSPPHVVPSKFSMGSVVWGGRNSLSSGNSDSRLTTPFCSAMPVVRTLNVEPGM